MNYFSGGNAYPVADPETLPGPEVRARRVAQDMEGIFGTARPVLNRTASANARTTAPIASRAPDGRATRSGSNGTSVLTGLAIAGVLAVSIILALNRTPDPASTPVTKVPQRPVTRVAEAPRIPTVLAPQVVPAEPRRMAGDHVATPPAKANAPLQPSRTAYHPKDMPRRSPAVRVVRTRKPTQHLVTTFEASTPAAQAAVPCDRLFGLDLARCMRPQVLDADQRLRDAYQDAVQAGVDRRVLVTYRRQWSKLRGRANSDPRGVTTGYRQIARQLDVARTGQPAGNR